MFCAALSHSLDSIGSECKVRVRCYLVNNTSVSLDTNRSFGHRIVNKLPAGGCQSAMRAFWVSWKARGIDNCLQLKARSGIGVYDQLWAMGMRYVMCVLSIKFG